MILVVGICAASLIPTRGNVQDKQPKVESDLSYQPVYQATPKRSLPVYIFGIHPLHNPQRLNAMYQPLIHHLNASLSGGALELEASRNYAAFDERLRTHHFHFALTNPYQALNASASGYRVIGKLGDDDEFRGVILTRADSPVRELKDLRGQAVVYPAPTAMASAMMPQLYLQKNGLDVHKDLRSFYVGSIESTIMSVHRGDAVAGGVWQSAWRQFAREQPDIAGNLVERWRTEPLLNYALVARNDTPEPVARQVAAVLFSLTDTPEGASLLRKIGVSRFESADNDVYKPIETFVAEYRAQIGKAPE